MRYFLLILAVALLMAPISFSATINVPADQPTIQAGIDAAVDGDTVLVANGIYAENINLSKGALLQSTNGPEYTFLRPASASLAILSISGGVDTLCQVNGFTIEGSNSVYAVSIDASYPLISENIFRNNKAKGAIKTTLGGIIRKNQFYDNTAASGEGGSAIKIMQGQCLVERNLFKREGGPYAVVFYAGDIKIHNNTFDSCSNSVMYVAGDEDVRNNIVSNSTSFQSYNIIHPGTPEGDYNNFWNNTNNVSPGPNGISADPLYDDPTNNDYYLQINSPCIDTGDPDPKYNDPDGTRNDIGALWYSLVEQPYAANINMGNENIQHVVNHTPSFYWTAVDSIGTQMTYRIEVGTDTSWDYAEMWETGEILSSDTFAIYSGSPLADGQVYYFRIAIYNGVNWGSWSQSYFKMNSIPTTPIPDHPVRQSLINVDYVRLAVSNSTDAEGDMLTYDFELYSDESMLELQYEEYAVSEQNALTYSSYISGLIAGFEYWWRARSKDFYEYSAWSMAESFLVREAGGVIYVPADQPSIQAGIDVAADGDTVVVADGIYFENISLSKRIIIQSANGPTSTSLQPVSTSLPILSISGGVDTLCRISGFTIEGSNDVYAMTIDESTPLISGNIFRNNHNMGAIRTALGGIIRNNRFYDNTAATSEGGSAIKIMQGQCLVERNLFKREGGPYAVVFYAGDIKIHNNTFDSCSNSVMYVAGDEDVRNNIVSNSTSFQSYNIIHPGTPEGDYNNFWNNMNNVSPGPNGISANPLYEDPTNNIYYLQINSPCIDAGDPDPQYNDPDDSRNDMGAFPFTVGNYPPILDPIGEKTVSEFDTLKFLVTASDPDGVIASLTALPLPNGAIFVDSGNGIGNFRWAPRYDQSGFYEIVFSAIDDSGAVDSEVVPIYVGNVNRPPMFLPIDSQQVWEGGHLEFLVMAADPDEDNIVLEAIEPPENASFVDSGNGRGLFSFDPAFDQSGEYQLLFTVSDQELSDSMLVSMLVREANPSVSDLYIAGDSTPYNVVNHNPEITWQFHDPTGAHVQTQYEVAVSIDEDWTYAEMWNPAPYAGAGTSIVYAGAVLVDGETYYLRLRVYNGIVWSDWCQTVFQMNSIPSIPIPLSPIGEVIVETSTPQLWIINSSDAEDDTLTYNFGVFSGLDTTSVITIGADIPGQPDSSSWEVDVALDIDTIYYWAVRAYDGYELSAWSDVQSFVVNAIQQYPATFDLIWPPDTGWGQVYDFPTPFQWQSSSDPDPGDSVYYRLKIAVDSNFMFTATYDSLYQNTYAVPALNYGTHYWWKVSAVDTKGNITPSAGVADFMTWVLGDANRDYMVNVGDAVFLINFVFKSGDFPEPFKIGDINGDCEVNVGDPVTLINYIFKGGAAPSVGCAEWVPPPVK